MNYKQEAIELMVRAGVLTFGDFTTKSGRKTPYFINTGNFKTGAQLEKLGEIYAHRLYEGIGLDFAALFGPAYKGIPLACAASMALCRIYGSDKPYCFNRKEAKGHGEGGTIIGYRPVDGDRLVLIEDVVTAGTAVRETLELFRHVADVSFGGLVVLADRCERGLTEYSALQELEQNYGIRTYPIVTIYEILDFLYNREVNGRIWIDTAMRESVERYLEQYGAKR